MIRRVKALTIDDRLSELAVRQSEIRQVHLPSIFEEPKGLPCDNAVIQSHDSRKRVESNDLRCQAKAKEFRRAPWLTPIAVRQKPKNGRMQMPMHAPIAEP